MPTFRFNRASASDANKASRGKREESDDTQSSSVLDGAAPLNNSDYATKAREIMELYRALLDLHANTVFDLPRVAVIGKQSSGKSSLVEAVTGINVPRDSGTCTRCPMVCTMSSKATSWSCIVSLRRMFTQNGTPLATPTIEQFGGVIEDPSAVELQIRRAQAAILSPHLPASDFYSLSKEELTQNARSDNAMLEFSKNEIQVEVLDPNATDLTFVDLPGLIQNHSNQNLITLVRELTKDYISKKNTLIVITMPMADDIQNMEAVTLAKGPRADPKKERTIGVITKPDDLSQGSTGLREAWKAILEGRQLEHDTKHGYYCVRLPDDDQRRAGMSRSEAERFASDWFSANSPWSGMEDRSRFGVPNFVKDISQLLIELIERNLPKLRKTVKEELEKCQKDIDDLPPELDLKDPSTEVMLRISNFCKDIKEAVFGKNHKSFVQLNKGHYLRFKNEIQMTTPDFRPVENAASSQYTAVHSYCQPRGLEEVRNVIEGSITWELPGHIPFEATKSLVMQYTSLWKDPSIHCFRKVVTQMDVLLDKLLEEHFGRFNKLKEYMRKLTTQDREICREDAHQAVEKLLCREIDPLFTQNFEALQVEKRHWSATYGQYPAKPRSSVEYGSSWFPARLSVSHHFSPKMYPHISGSSHSAQDVTEVMANVQAYFQVAHKRVIDYIPLTVEHELNQAFANGIDKTLFAAISKDTLSGEVSFQDLLGEDPAIKVKRGQLKERKARLMRIKEKLDNFQQSTLANLDLPDYESDSEPPSPLGLPSRRASWASGVAENPPPMGPNPGQWARWSPNASVASLREPIEESIFTKGT